MTNMPDEIVLARIITALDLGFKRALHYHDKGYVSDNDYGLPGQVIRPVHVYSVSTTEASFNPTDYNGAQCPISPFTSRQLRDELHFHHGVHQCLNFDETPLPAVNSDIEEYLPTADLDDPVWSREPVPNSQKHLSIHQIHRPATPPHNLSSGGTPRAGTNGYQDPRGPSRPHQCPQRTVF